VQFRVLGSVEIHTDDGRVLTLHPDVGLHTVAEELRDTQQRWQALSGDDPAADVRVVPSWSYQTLAPEAARLFRLLGLHPGPDITVPAAASLTAMSPEQVRPLVAELVRANLITQHAPGRYTLHDPLRAYATHLTCTTDPDRQRHAATHRVLDHYLHTAYTADRLLNPARDAITLTPAKPGVAPEHLTDHQRAIDWFTGEHPVLLAAVDHAAATGFHTHSGQLVWAMQTFLYRHGHWRDQITSCHAAVAAAERLGDPTGQALARRNLAGAYTQLRRFDEAEAELNQALDLYRQVGDETGQAHTHHGLAHLWQRRGDPVRALDHARQNPSSVPVGRPPERARRGAQRGRLVLRPARRPPAGAHLL
jgi:hypothetical protein